MRRGRTFSLRYSEQPCPKGGNTFALLQISSGSEAKASMAAIVDCVCLGVHSFCSLRFLDHAGVINSFQSFPQTALRIRGEVPPPSLVAQAHGDHSSVGGPPLHPSSAQTGTNITSADLGPDVWPSSPTVGRVPFPCRLDLPPGPFSPSFKQCRDMRGYIARGLKADCA